MIWRRSPGRRSRWFRAAGLSLARGLCTAACAGGGEEPVAPPECITAWRAEVTAPVRCEEYPDAYQAIQKELGR
jgi:hypothetical protein